MLLPCGKKFIFVHIYKTAGTSVMDVFLPYARFIDKLVYGNKYTRKIISKISLLMDWDDDGNKQFTGIHNHTTAEQIKSKYGPGVFNNYFKFAFVRNPYDLLASLYFYIMQSKHHIFNNNAKNTDFEEFLKWYIGKKPFRLVDFIMDT